MDAFASEMMDALWNCASPATDEHQSVNWADLVDASSSSHSSALRGSSLNREDVQSRHERIFGVGKARDGNVSNSHSTSTSTSTPTSNLYSNLSSNASCNASSNLSSNASCNASSNLHSNLHSNSTSDSNVNTNAHEVTDGKTEYTPLNPAGFPEDLRPVIEDGFRLTESTPHFLKVFVEAVSSGEAVGCAGWWGEERAARAANWHARLPGTTDQTVERGYLYAIIRTLEACPHDMPLQITFGNDTVWDIITCQLRKWQDKWHNESLISDVNRDMMGHLIVLLRQREHEVQFQLAWGHFGWKKAHVSFHSGLQTQPQFRARMATKLPPVRPRLATKWLRPDNLVREPRVRFKHVVAVKSLGY